MLKPNLDERVDADDITIRVLDLIREIIPEPVVYDGEEYDMGWNDAIQKVKDNLFK